MPDPTPAVRKVQLAVREAIEARRPPPTLFVFTDRTDDEPLSDGEWPAAIVKVLTVQMSHGPEQGQTMHDALVHIECQSGNTAANSIDAVNQITIADIIAAIHADRSLGGLVDECEEDVSDASENAGVDVGAAVLLLRVRFFTPRGDLYTIVGVGGQLFT